MTGFSHLKSRRRALTKPYGTVGVIGLIVCACLAGNLRQRPALPQSRPSMPIAGSLLETAAMVDASPLGIMF